MWILKLLLVLQLRFCWWRVVFFWFSLCGDSLRKDWPLPVCVCKHVIADMWLQETLILILFTLIYGCFLLKESGFRCYDHITMCYNVFQLTLESQIQDLWVGSKINWPLLLIFFWIMLVEIFKKLKRQIFSCCFFFMMLSLISEQAAGWLCDVLWLMHPHSRISFTFPGSSSI